MSDSTFTLVLGLSALMLAASGRACEGERVRAMEAHWLPCLVLVALAGASMAVGLRYPQLMAAAYG
jgi:hypothetical protein